MIPIQGHYLHFSQDYKDQQWYDLDKMICIFIYWLSNLSRPLKLYTLLQFLPIIILHFMIKNYSIDTIIYDNDWYKWSILLNLNPSFLLQQIISHLLRIFPCSLCFVLNFLSVKFNCFHGLNKKLSITLSSANLHLLSTL